MHPTPSTDRRAAGRALVGKALAEWAYEELLVPVPEGDGHVVVLPGATYSFAARRTGFGAWRVDAASVTRDGAPAEDPVQLVLDAREALGLDGPTAAEVVRELTATLTADTRIRAHARPVAELADLGYAELEQHLTGHPVLVLSKGRLGFTARDLDRWAPESRDALRLRWWAAHRSTASYAGVEPDALLDAELGPDVRAAMRAELAATGADPDDYVWLPVHPFQEDAVVRTLFAGHVDDGRLVPLGEGPIAYRPVQSVRTLVAPGRRDVKTALLVRNTLVWRGLGADATAAAPAVSAWLEGVLSADPDLARTGFAVLTEVASAVVRHEAYDALPDAPYRYGELLGAVWRTPVEAHLVEGETARSLACLLHVDRDGAPLLGELVRRSGLTARAWLERLAEAVLPGLLLVLTRHGVALCPHGENAVLVFRDEVPVRVLVKDLAEDVTLLPGRTYPGLPADADAVLVRWPAQEMAHSVLSALLAGVVRFLAPLAEEHLDVTEQQVWGVWRDAVLAWRAAHPDLQDALDALGLLERDVERIALNREHLTGGGFHDRAERDAAPDVVHGRAPNPVAAA